MKASVISPERVVFEGEVSSVVAPAFDGEVGILPRHAPMVTLLGRGVLRLESVGPGEGAGTRRFNVQGGFLQVADNVVRLVTESAEPVATSAA
jgi:F-type H+-transporting ATPase subunit epsilon